MTDYVVGDIQGCHDSLHALLHKVSFNPSTDTLYCVGDLINRGPKSLETLELLHSLGDSAKIVLGNHDLHLIFCFHKIRQLKSIDTAHSILSSPRASFWIDWLKQFPLMIYNAEKDFIVCHAGLYPQWSIEQGISYSNKFSSMLKSDKSLKIIKKIYGDKPTKFSTDLSETKLLRFSVNSFTRMRYCYTDMSLNFTKKNFPTSSAKLQPWFNFDRQQISKQTRIIFGHWSSLGLYHHNNVICLDTGCVWGNELTLYNIDSDQFIHQLAID